MALDVKALAVQLEGIHHIAAAFFETKNPVLAAVIPIDESESKQLAESIAAVAKHYNLTPNPVLMSWVALAGAVGIIYYPKVVLYKSSVQAV